MEAVESVTVTPDAVYFNERELPWPIARDGVRFRPGGYDDVNTLSIDFFVGEVHFTDSSVFGYDAETKWWALRSQIEDEWALATADFDDFIGGLNGGS